MPSDSAAGSNAGLLQVELGALTRIMAVLEEGRAARAVDLTPEEALAVKGLQLLTRKPLTYAANVSEADLADGGQSNAQVTALQQKAKEENCEVVVVSAQVPRDALPPN